MFIVTNKIVYCKYYCTDVTVVVKHYDEVAIHFTTHPRDAVVVAVM